jgi:hypothetical protein
MQVCKGGKFTFVSSESWSCSAIWLWFLGEGGLAGEDGEVVDVDDGF